ncbi:unnamed protein product [Adineta steineri]|uniref:Uncharacterized protein n=1 Tax=Adineta steineri TaxID=433720 RepID=A0A819RC56_9BILA|nr:unnamed protein product [Adineta steineri]CAF4045486.1 unnamed protein product [Adineta steineri]
MILFIINEIRGQAPPGIVARKRVGGSEGSPFNDSEILRNSKIYAPQTISMTKGEYDRTFLVVNDTPTTLLVESIRITYEASDGTPFNGPKHGTGSSEVKSSGPCQSVTLGVGEKIIQVSGKNDSRIISLQFITDKGRIIPNPGCGGSRGNQFTDEKSGYYLSFISGRSGWVLDQIQFYWAKFPDTTTTSTTTTTTSSSSSTTTTSTTTTTSSTTSSSSTSSSSTTTSSSKSSTTTISSSTTTTTSSSSSTTTTSTTSSSSTSSSSTTTSSSTSSTTTTTTVSIITPSTTSTTTPSSSLITSAQKTSPMVTAMSNVISSSSVFIPKPCTDSTFIGLSCNISNTPCEMGTPCENDGTCMSNKMATYGYICSCPSGFTGTYCELDQRICKPHLCLHNGTCNETLNTTFHCVCENGWEGIHCESMVNHCEGVECMNNGVCRPLLLGYKCECLGTSYYGSHCEFTARKVVISKIISKSFSYIAIIAMSIVVMFIVIMDILTYCFGIDMTRDELEQFRREKRDKKRINRRVNKQLIRTNIS